MSGGPLTSLVGNGSRNSSVNIANPTAIRNFGGGRAPTEGGGTGSQGGSGGLPLGDDIQFQTNATINYMYAIVAPRFGKWVVIWA